VTKYVPTTTQAGDVNELRRYTLGELYRISSSLATVEATGNAVEVVATLPTTGNFEGRVVYLTTDDKLYSHNGTVWSPVAADYVVSGSSIMSYAQATQPASTNTGDIWFDTSTTANTPRRYSGTAWVSVADARVAGLLSALSVETTTRQSADESLAQLITNLTATVSTNNTNANAAITNEQTVRATADTALASNISSLTATVNTNNTNVNARIATEETVRATADTALASSISSLTATVNTNKSEATAAITNEQTVRANADSALASNITSLTATVTNNNNTLTAAVNNEQTARIDGDEALAQQITQLIVSGGSAIMTYAQSTAPANPNIGDIWFDTSTTANTPKRWNGTAWVALSDARVEANAAAIVTEQTARINGDSALATSITDLAAVVSTNNSTQQAAISNEQTVRANADSALASNITALTATVNTNNTNANAAVSAEQTARATADSALATRATNLEATVNSTTLGNTALQARIATEESARASGDTALATRATSLEATVGSAPLGNSALQARIAAEETARATADSALATRATSLEATVNSATTGNTALQSRIATEESARASGDATNAASITSLTSTVNGQSASITTLQSTSASLQGDVTNLNAQYGVTVSAGKVTGFKLNSSATTSDFIVQADRFKIENASGAPFEVIGGVTYLKEAMINTLNADKITTGTLSASRIILDGQTLVNSGGTLRVGDAGINTVNIGANAVTRTTAAFIGSTTIPPSNGSWASVGSVTMTVDAGSTVRLDASMFCAVDSSAFDTAWIEGRWVRGAAVIGYAYLMEANPVSGLVDVGGQLGNINLATRQTGNPTVIALDTAPSSGSTTWTFQVRRSGSAFTNNTTLIATEIRR